MRDAIISRGGKKSELQSKSNQQCRCGGLVALKWASVVYKSKERKEMRE
jgi:hypothetical protein